MFNKICIILVKFFGLPVVNFLFLGKTVPPCSYRYLIFVTTFVPSLYFFPTALADIPSVRAVITNLRVLTPDAFPFS